MIVSVDQTHRRTWVVRIAYGLRRGELEAWFRDKDTALTWVEARGLMLCPDGKPDFVAREELQDVWRDACIARLAADAALWSEEIQLDP